MTHPHDGVEKDDAMAVEATDAGPAEVPDPAIAPGGRAALSRGCTCSVLANAAFRAGVPGETPFVDPRCPLHARQVS